MKSPAQEPAHGTFTNPIIRSTDAGDPFMTFANGSYYFTATLDPEGGLWVWQSSTITGTDNGRKVKVWTAPASGPRSQQIWAPELHFLRGKWYLYYTASDGVDANHRHYVLESVTDDPLGEYIDRGRVDPDFNAYAIDGSILETPELYFLYTTGSLIIKRMSDPCRVTGEPVVIAKPDMDWERGWVEGPQVLKRNGRLFIIYSAGHSGKPHYVLGMLTHNGGDVMDPDSWVKSPQPVFQPYEGADGKVYTTGHNSFTCSPDGTEDWIIYHAKDSKTGGFKGRTARAQPFTWREDGSPEFGHPVPAGVPLPLPSGENR